MYNIKAIKCILSFVLMTSLQVSLSPTLQELTKQVRDLRKRVFFLEEDYKVTKQHNGQNQNNDTLEKRIKQFEPYIKQLLLNRRLLQIESLLDQLEYKQCNPFILQGMFQMIKQLLHQIAQEQCEILYTSEIHSKL